MDFLSGFIKYFFILASGFALILYAIVIYAARRASLRTKIPIPSFLKQVIALGFILAIFSLVFVLLFQP
ncbi:MAG: hypothetical protein HY427_02035 [Candidatus Levybacteria bacterium]|nr:hypothetical protein [Candidatus Levybacteria bacterium]